MGLGFLEAFERLLRFAAELAGELAVPRAIRQALEALDQRLELLQFLQRGQQRLQVLYPADSLFGEFFVISEVILGYFTLGLLLAILANTIARRS